MIRLCPKGIYSIDILNLVSFFFFWKSSTDRCVFLEKEEDVQIFLGLVVIIVIPTVENASPGIQKVRRAF